MKEFSLILPTRERPMLLKRLLDSIAGTVSNPEQLEIVLYIDDDDIESHKVSHPSLCIVKQIGPRPRKSMGTIIRDCFRASRGRYIMLINDDVVFRTNDWDVKLLQALSRFPDEVALVYGKDLYYDEEMCTFPILPRTTCDLMDGICPAEYDNHCIDSHVFDTFKRLSSLGYDRSVYLPKVVFEHMNYELGTSAYEQGFNRKNDQEDQAVYLSFAQQRQNTAEKMAQHIKYHENKSAKAVSARTDKVESPANVASHNSAHTLKNALVSIIMPAQSNSWNYTSAYIKAILKGNNDRALSIEFVVVTNGETEQASKCPKKIRKKLTIVSSGQSDPAGTYNAGASAAKGDYLVFLDGNSCPQQGWLKALVEAAQDESIGVVGSRWLNSRNGRVEHVGIAFHRDNSDLKETDIYRGLAADHPAVNKTREVQAVRRVGMLVKKELFLRLGGYSETCAGLEGIDLCLKVRQSGKRIVCAAKADLYCDRKEHFQEYAEHVSEKAAFLSSRAEQIECDLEKILSEDGFELHSCEKSSYIFPSEERIRKLADTEGDCEKSRELLEGSLELVKSLKGEKDDLAMTCRELLDVYFSLGCEKKIGEIHRMMQAYELSDPVTLAAYQHMVRADKRNMGTVESVDMYAGTRFVIPVAASISQVRMKLLKKRTPTDSVVAYIYDDNEGPNMPLANAVSNPVGASGITSGPDGQWSEFIFSDSVPLAAHTFYWIVLHRTGTADDKNYYRILLDSSPDCKYQYASDYYGPQATHGNINDRISQLFKILGVVAPNIASTTHNRRESSAMKWDIQNELAGEVLGG